MHGYITDKAADEGLRFADDLPEPDLSANELMLEVCANGVNRGELALIAARAQDWRPGQDVSGVVLRAAADGGGPRQGDRIVGVVDGAGWSERVAVAANRAASIPGNVTFAQAASLPVAGLTAYRALRRGGKVLGRRVLVLGATGGVGQFAVQLARAAGADVTAQISRPEREADARKLGATRTTISLDEDDLGPFALIFDGLGNDLLTKAVDHLEQDGCAIVYGATGDGARLALPDLVAAPNTRIAGIIGLMPQDQQGADLAILARLVGDGRLDPSLGEVRDWSEAPAVLDGLRNRQIRSKAVLTHRPLEA